MDQAPTGEFFEDANEALREAVRALGGNKKVGALLRPELPLEQATNWLRDCLNPDRREKLSPEQAFLLLRLAREAGYHAAMTFIAGQIGYEARPVDVTERVAELQRSFVEAVSRLEQIQAQLKNVQMRRVA
jgi:hypothetical protein